MWQIELTLVRHEILLHQIKSHSFLVFRCDCYSFLSKHPQRYFLDHRSTYKCDLVQLWQTQFNEWFFGGKIWLSCLSLHHHYDVTLIITHCKHTAVELERGCPVQAKGTPLPTVGINSPLYCRHQLPVQAKWAHLPTVGINSLFKQNELTSLL